MVQNRTGKALESWSHVEFSDNFLQALFNYKLYIPKTR